MSEAEKTALESAKIIYPVRPGSYASAMGCISDEASAYLTGWKERDASLFSKPPSDDEVEAALIAENGKESWADWQVRDPEGVRVEREIMREALEAAWAIRRGAHASDRARHPHSSGQLRDSQSRGLRFDLRQLLRLRNPWRAVDHEERRHERRSAATLQGLLEVNYGLAAIALFCGVFLGMALHQYLQRRWPD